MRRLRTLRVITLSLILVIITASGASACDEEPAPTPTPTPTPTTPTPTPTPTPTAPTPAPSPSDPPPSEPVPVAFGAATGTTGGDRSDIVVVTSLADAGPGTLREATSQPGRHVVAAPGLTGTLRLLSALELPSDTTVDLSDGAVLVTGWGLGITGVDNVIVRGIAFADIDTDTDGDAIRVSDAATHVWIDHNSFYGAVDGSVDVTQQSTLVTVSGNHFSRTAKTMLLGHPADRGTPTRVDITVADNHFDHTGERTPYARHGRIHLTGNVFDAYGYQHDSGHAVKVGCGAQMLIQDNAFMVQSNPRAVVSGSTRRCADDRLPGVQISDNLISDDLVSGEAQLLDSTLQVPVIGAPVRIPMTLGQAEWVRDHSGAAGFIGAATPHATRPGDLRPGDTSAPLPVTEVDLAVQLNSPVEGTVEVSWSATGLNGRYQYALVRCEEGIVRLLEETGGTAAVKGDLTDGCYTARVRQLTSPATAWHSSAPFVLGPTHYVRH